ncbi:GGDEF domain-containing protein [Treponema sp. OMZ 788]|uniref:GGDEF domain-containing protein n=1 Tax=Treponema sp. OMZ 788 TaxID=2563664 RepID=UPI0020A46753|nr:GGDEF domain-containing protein [Treponema sp. OMZ 788]UTC64503.1 GGDEF domain-containing protein [Treponema sp. OMZ 788]
MKKYNYEITENTAKNRLYGIFNDNETIARDEINSLQTYFRSIHIQTQFVIIIIAFCFEFFYYFIFQNQMALPFSEYSLKYIILPFAINFPLYIITKILNQKFYDSNKKNYIVMLSSLLQSFLYVIIHQIFVTIYAGLLVMIFLSAIYHDKKLTRITSFIAVIETILAAFVIKYDGYHIITIKYLANFIVLLFILIIAHVTAEFIINSNKSEQSKILYAIEEKEKYWYGMMIDDLSGLYSRAALRTYINKLQNYQGELLIVMIDLDNFKTINDTYGHQYGDEVIRILGQTFNPYLGDSFSAFRYGGDEFLAIIKSDKAYAEKLMTETKEAFRKSCLTKFKNFEPSFSAGISRFSSNMPITDTIEKADSALYKAKKAGKNTYIFYEE